MVEAGTRGAICSMEEEAVACSRGDGGSTKPSDGGSTEAGEQCMFQKSYGRRRTEEEDEVGCSRGNGGSTKPGDDESTEPGDGRRTEAMHVSKKLWWKKKQGRRRNSLQQRRPTILVIHVHEKGGKQQNERTMCRKMDDAMKTQLDGWDFST